MNPEQMQTPIVLLHSLGTDSQLWRHQIAAFDAIGPVVAFDSRGHGTSPWPGSTSMQEWVFDLHRDIAAIGPVHLVGLSMGGMQAVAFAAEHPDLVQSLTIANSFAVLPSEVAGSRVAAAERAISEGGISAYADTYLAETLTKPMAADDYAVLRDSISGTSEEAYLASAVATFNGDVTGYLAGIRCPTLALTGDKDQKTPLAVLQRIADGINNCQLAVIENAGHLSCIENPAAFNREVGRFLAECNSQVAGNAREAF